MSHWTTENSESFIRRVTFDYWTQLQKRFDSMPVTQLELAKIFGVSESAISQTLNNSKNPTLKTLFNYAQVAKLKFAIVPYEDSDPERSPINSEIFTLCWEKAGRPRTFGQARALPNVAATAFTGESLIVPADRAYYKPRRHGRQSPKRGEPFSKRSFIRQKNNAYTNWQCVLRGLWWKEIFGWDKN